MIFNSTSPVGKFLFIVSEDLFGICFQKTSREPICSAQIQADINYKKRIDDDVDPELPRVDPNGLVKPHAQRNDNGNPYDEQYLEDVPPHRKQ